MLDRHHCQRLVVQSRGLGAVPPGQRATSTVFVTSHAVEVAAGSSVTFYLRCRDISGGAGNDSAVSGARLSGLFPPGTAHTIEAEPAP